MNRIKVLDNIQPFNEVFYKGCFFNSLFPAIRHFNKSILPVLVNDVTVYKRVAENGNLRLSMRYLSKNSLEDVLDNMGIAIDSFSYRENLTDNITKAILLGRPVIIYVDSFYEPFRIDTYQKKHVQHSFLVYGYDYNKSVMNIIEHKHRDNLSYENRVIKYSDIKNSYEGFHMEFQSNIEIPSYYEIQLIKSYIDKTNIDFSLNECIKVLIENFVEKEEQFFYGLEQLKVFTGEFGELVSNELILNKEVDNLIKGFNKIINVKQVEIYKISRLFGEKNNIVKIQQECLEHWNLIRAVVAKYKYSNIYRIENFGKLGEILKTIYKIEKLYYRNIVSLS